MMRQSSLHRPIGKGIVFGAIGGFVGGLVMYTVMSGVMEAIGMGANCFAVILALITGQPFSNSLVPIGLAIHLVTSTIIGAIFGIVITSINKLRVNRFARGISFGVAAGLIAFVVLFLPIAVIAMPPKMMELMKMMPMSGSSSSQMMSSGNSNAKPGGMIMTVGSGGGSSSSAGMSEKSGGMNNEQMMMMKNELPKMQSMIMAGSLLSHIIYGAALGSVVTILLVKTARTTAANTKRDMR
jgi:hypothetical protein